MFQVLKFILFVPFAFIYWIVLQLRYFIYKVGFKQSHQFRTPIISVGNLTVGGTGKTPMVYFIAKELQNYFKSIVIISRGYGRKSKGFQMIHDGKKLKSNVETAGDESFLIANLLKNCIVVVDENRIRAIKIIEQRFNPSLMILDDGFQQLGIIKDINILLLNSSKSFRELYLLPIGYARETKKQIYRADVMVLTKTNEFKFPDWIKKLNYKNDIFSTVFKYKIFQYLKNEYKLITEISNPVFAFCGIGDPDSFKIGMRKLRINPIQIKIFKDHESYSSNIINKLKMNIQRLKVKQILTTEKDLIKLPNNFLLKYNIFILKISYDFEDKHAFIKYLRTKLKKE